MRRAHLILGALLVLGCASEEDRKAAQLARADQRIAAGETGEAQVALQNALMLDPTDGEVSRRLAELARSEGKTEEAIFYFGEAVRLDPERVDTRLQLAHLLRSRDPARARALLEPALASESSRLRASVLLADVALAQNEFDEALAAAEAAVQLAPANIPALLQLARARESRIRVGSSAGGPIEESDFKAALQPYRKAAALGGRRPGPLVLEAWRGQVRLLELWPRASPRVAPTYRRGVVALESAPTLQRQFLDEAIAYAESHTDQVMLLDWATGRERALRSSDPAAPPPSRRSASDDAARRYLDLAELRAGRGELPTALDALRRGLELTHANDSERSELLLLMGSIQLRTGAYGPARESFASALAASGAEQVPAAFAVPYARVLRASGSPEPAKEVLAKAALQGADAPVEVFVELVRYSGDPRLARRVFEAGLRAHPHSAPLVEQLTRAEVRAKRLDSAVARSAEAARLHPGRPQLLLLHARTLATVERTDEAIAAARALLAAHPGMPAVPELLLVLLREQGRGEQVLAELRGIRASGALSIGDGILLSRLLTANGDEEEAIAVLSAVLEESERLPAAQSELAYLLATRGKELARATRLAREARRVWPTSARVAANLGFVLHQRGAYELALVEFDAALVLASPSSSPWATAQYRRARTLFAMERSTEAREAVEQALASGSEFAESKEARALLTQLTG